MLGIKRVNTLAGNAINRLYGQTKVAIKLFADATLVTIKQVCTIVRTTKKTANIVNETLQGGREGWGEEQSEDVSTYQTVVVIGSFNCWTSHNPPFQLLSNFIIILFFFITTLLVLEVEPFMILLDLQSPGHF